MHTIPGLITEVKNGKTIIGVREGTVLSDEQLAKVVEMNATLDDATFNAVSAGCFDIQKMLGIDAGDYAGVYFSGDEANEAVRQTMVKYLFAELRWAQVHAQDDESHADDGGD